MCFVFPLCYLTPVVCRSNRHHLPPAATTRNININNQPDFGCVFCLAPHNNIPPQYLPSANSISTRAHRQGVSQLKLNCCFHILPPIGCRWRSVQSHHVVLVLDNKTQKCRPQLKHVKKTSPKFVFILCHPNIVLKSF